jgi:hypothetical protein
MIRSFIPRSRLKKRSSIKVSTSLQHPCTSGNERRKKRAVARRVAEYATRLPRDERNSRPDTNTFRIHRNCFQCSAIIENIHHICSHCNDRSPLRVEHLSHLCSACSSCYRRGPSGLVAQKAYRVQDLGTMFWDRRGYTRTINRFGFFGQTYSYR